ncbi:MAG: hypothetical protein KC657_24940 [Myxococcales bacterium]|nr:hypothetical protein [Myxococcales bacterium]
MVKVRPIVRRVAVAALLLSAGCSALLGLDDLTDLPAAPTTEAGADAGVDAPDGAPGKSTKVDVLLVVDDSSSMGDKSRLLASSLDPLLREIATAGDVHLGVITSSLGGIELCAKGRPSSRAHLVRTGADGGTLPSAASGFLTYDATKGVDAFIAEAKSVVVSVEQSGCGVEAPLESAYRFLVQPDPWNELGPPIGLGNSPYLGIDQAVLAERRAFLRPDSLVVVVMITDEDDASLDPGSVRGQGVAFAQLSFPGSTTQRPNGGTTAPRPTQVCATNPASPDCTSCGFGLTCDAADAGCLKIKNDPGCTGDGGPHYGATEDDLNVRFFDMKRRFGVDPLYPVRRYVTGLTEATVPKREEEHFRALPNGGAEYSDEYAGLPSCTNPLFAANLPQSDAEELCALTRGPRRSDQVVFALITGAPQSLLDDPSNPAWDQLVGVDPEKFDASTQDPHMRPSIAPRPSLAGPSPVRGDNGTDPAHGREYDTNGQDLQFACTFALDPVRVCDFGDPSCDCADPTKNPPLCTATLGEQARAKAYPGIRPLRVAKGLGDRAIVGSICPPPRKTYTDTMTRLAELLRPKLR